MLGDEVPTVPSGVTRQGRVDARREPDLDLGLGLGRDIIPGVGIGQAGRQSMDPYRSLAWRLSGRGAQEHGRNV